MCWDGAMPGRIFLWMIGTGRCLLEKAAAALDCKPDQFIGSVRVFGSAKINRDLLMYFFWQLGVYTNEEIGSLFKVSYSSVSRNVSSFRKKLTEVNNPEKLLDRIMI